MSEPSHHESFFTSRDGLSLYRQSWLPAGEARAIVAVFHGLGEHSGRYAHVAASLVGAGFGVHALDHRGHGKSDGKRAYLKSYDEFMGDLVQFRSLVESEHPGKPLIVLGHSMGGNLAVGHALDHQAGLAGLVLSGPALKVGDDFSAVQLKIFGLMGRLLPGVRPQALNAEAISRDPAVVEAYVNDPLVFTGKITAGLGAALINAMETFPPRYHELRLPILLMHGTADQLANIDGTRELEAAATNATITSHYYEGLFHEIFNEPEQQRVIGDLLTWLDAVLE